jgi:uncharacterized protein involved in outer membrane biogenesis
LNQWTATGAAWRSKIFSDNGTDMTLQNKFKWIAAALLVPPLLAVAWIMIFGWGWLRAPIERMTAEKTGRVLSINGELTVHFRWPAPRLHAAGVTFANPAWAKEKQMIAADSVEIAVDLPNLLRRSIVLPEVHLERPVVFLEQASGGRKNWLLDVNQQDEDARIRIDRLTLDQGRLGYDNAEQKTSIRAELTTSTTVVGKVAAGEGVAFAAAGSYKGLAIKARGNGGPVLGLRDEETPYPLKIDLAVGRTTVKADGTITSLLKFSAMDMRLDLRGENLAQLFPLLGIAFPETRAYTFVGHIVHNGNTWLYDKFTGRIGDSDIAGMFQVDTGGKRPAIKAELSSKLLDLADLGTLIGSAPGRVAAARQAATVPAGTVTPKQARVIPDMPFSTDRWDSVDAEVGLKAKTIRRAKELPLEDLVTHLSLRDSVLTLDPLNFGVAGGDLNSVVTLDGRKKPIHAHAKVRARKILLSRLFPTVDLNKNSIGQINGEFDLTGTGNSVGRMLATSNGNVGLVVVGGEISKLMMETAGLHLWEILEIKVKGDRLIKLRCAVADFNVKNGSMQTDALIFDTEVTTIVGTGSIDLGQEQLDLTLNQKTKNTSPLAFRSPIYLRGNFARPDIGVDKGRVAMRALGAAALGFVNPLLALLPLIDPGPGKDSDCAQLVKDARALPKGDPKKSGPRT